MLLGVKLLNIIILQRNFAAFLPFLDLQITQSFNFLMVLVSHILNHSLIAGLLTSQCLDPLLSLIIFPFNPLQLFIYSIIIVTHCLHRITNPGDLMIMILGFLIESTDLFISPHVDRLLLVYVRGKGGVPA